ncbi:DUF4142 domain-containing protein [Pseudoxanthomonas sp. 10H]|uniref:DUF4142 domain-containing protein n=1 Tax=Pseudoxanthomonas sp. 10H TaxID=3242729 RepID=UPI0035575219
MNRKLLIAVAIAAGLATLTACGRRDEADVPDTAAADAAGPVDPAAPPATPATTGTGEAAAEAMPGMAQERAALGVLNAINAHEIAAGQQALGKSVGGDVAAYAQMMIDQHTENRDKTSAFGPDGNAPDAQAQKAKGEQELAALGGLEGDAYAKAYVDAMVKGHTEALAALDGTIIPAATRPEVKAHLATTREHVAQHLDRAKALQGQR